uniref:Uncharacterized protein n=1 Tax=Physcomitrium patens TaxID=3218 RepID=A0A2K1JR87_PHYPA|nr:hypothetical protein PHYPA_016426 [Physcomitrium patens]
MCKFGLRFPWHFEENQHCFYQDESLSESLRLRGRPSPFQVHGEPSSQGYEEQIV